MQFRLLVDPWTCGSYEENTLAVHGSNDYIAVTDIDCKNHKKGSFIFNLYLTVLLSDSENPGGSISFSAYCNTQ